jgi:UDP:flavonoid glycosyltransferase YjiC (YdhE family)
MKRIVLSTVGTQGDYLAFVALGEALSARGHSVVAAVNEAARPLFEAAGLEVMPCGMPYGDIQARSHAEIFDQWKPTRDANQRRLLRQIFDLESNYQDLLRACRDADLLVSISLQVAAPRVHDRLGIPWVAVSLLPGELAHQDRGGETPLDAPPAAKLLPPKAGGLEPLHGKLFFLEYLRAPLILLASSPHYSDPRVELYPALKMTGFWFYDGVAQETWRPSTEVRDFLLTEPRPVVLSLGSLPVRDAAGVVAVHALAARRAGMKLLVQRGWANLDASALPEGVTREDVLVTGNLPHDWLFANCSAVVHHGGIGTTARAVRNGLPMIVEPYGRDQFFNAWRVTALELGVAMHPHKLTAEGLSRALEVACGPRIRQRVSEVGDLIRAERGVALACTYIEAFLNGGERGGSRTQTFL